MKAWKLISEWHSPWHFRFSVLSSLCENDVLLTCLIVKMRFDWIGGVKSSFDQVSRYESVCGCTRVCVCVYHRDVLHCVISSSCFPQTLPHPLLVPPPPHNETNTKEQEVPPVNWGPIKAIIIPVSEFLQEMASQKICQLCRECGIIVSQVVSVFACFLSFFFHFSPC